MPTINEERGAAQFAFKKHLYDIHYSHEHL